jgi:riboflavin synthase
MFTGLIEEMGQVTHAHQTPNGLNLTITAKKVIKNLKMGDSIAVNGVCLTVVHFNTTTFSADVMPESLQRSGLNKIKLGQKVNLEKSLTLASSLGGHLVTGDVECEGKIVAIQAQGFAQAYTLELPAAYTKYVVEKGRIALDGASLTVASVHKNQFTVILIPHTQKMITLGQTKVGDSVNVETDLIGKFVEKTGHANNKPPQSKITAQFLTDHGF